MASFALDLETRRTFGLSEYTKQLQPVVADNQEASKLLIESKITEFRSSLGVSRNVKPIILVS